jgi:hypothetical protein
MIHCIGGADGSSAYGFGQTLKVWLRWFVTVVCHGGLSRWFVTMAW